MPGLYFALRWRCSWCWQRTCRGCPRRISRRQYRVAYASLLAGSSDLGPSQHGDAQLTVTLPAPTRPDALFAWADTLGLSVRWRPDDAWAIVEALPRNLAKGFDVPVHDYRGRKGQVFYASFAAALGAGAAAR